MDAVTRPVSTNCGGRKFVDRLSYEPGLFAADAALDGVARHGFGLLLEELRDAFREDRGLPVVAGGGAGLSDRPGDLVDGRIGVQFDLATAAGAEERRPVLPDLCFHDPAVPRPSFVVISSPRCMSTGRTGWRRWWRRRHRRNRWPRRRRGGWLLRRLPVRLNRLDLEQRAHDRPRRERWERRHVRQRRWWRLSRLRRLRRRRQRRFRHLAREPGRRQRLRRQRRPRRLGRRRIGWPLHRHHQGQRLDRNDRPRTRHHTRRRRKRR